MKKQNSTRKSLMLSAVALLCCFVMLLGTTYAWFTDTVTSAGNTIQSGSLKIDLLHKTGEDKWTSVKETPDHKVFDYDKWEPGFTAVEMLKVVNLGTLALRYQLSLVVQINSAELGPNGENLADVIDVYVNEGDGTANNWATIKDNWTRKGTLTEVINNPADFFSGMLKPMSDSNTDDEKTLTVALHMQETAGNEYQNLSVGIINVNLIATQATNESDSFGSDYDSNAVADIFPGFQGGSASTVVTLDDQGKTTTEVTLDGGDVSAVIPAGVKLAQGNNTLQLTVGLKDTSETNLQLEANEKMRPMDVHMEGVAQDNDTAMVITLKHYLTTGLNIGALTLYHVENGVDVAMTYAANPANHNEFSYDPHTGDLTVALASFSEVAVVADTNNPWNGETEVAYTGSGTEADPYLIESADQLAYFRTQVDNGNSFEGKTVKLGNNIYLSGQLFDPIGWGYVNTEWNSGGVAGNVFQGTFDGGEYDEEGELIGRYTIFDLYQSGWDLEEATKTDYTYTNCGFGLFAAASGATFRNLNISGAYVRAECVEMGVLVGLSQNSCTYENIEIHNSKIANYQRPAGGLIGEVSGAGTTTITNVTIGSDVVVGSLWGDFDAPCGGVIGARWDDVGADPQIVMQYVEVGARMDVYSDVTSAYQWYAYRRAGMLIGNTELTEPNDAHKAAAPFLTCLKDDAGNKTVKVYYGDWAAYHYCQFTNQDNAWCNNYPWVRVEAGENCNPYSNPRYGQPVVGGVTVSTDTHTCTGEHLMERRFNQLYGGGQGVYGQFEHEGVEVINYRYSITYVNDYEVLAIKYVTESGAVSTANDVAKSLVLEWAKENIEGGTIAFGGWMNAGSTKLSEIPADNTKDIVLYPYFNSPYTANFVDQYGNILAWCLFNDADVSRLSAAFATAQKNLPELEEGFELSHWEIRGKDTKDKKITVTLNKDNTNWDSFKGYKDVTIYPYYKYNGAELIPVDNDSDGEVDYYQAAGYGNGLVSTVVKIPGSVNGKPVTEINANAFSSYDKLHVVVIPTSVETIGNKAISDQGNLFAKQETVTIYYEGSYEQWKAKNYGDNWITGLSEDSRVFFLNGGDTVDTTVYLQVKQKSYLVYISDYSFEEKTNTANLVGEYYTNCNCDVDGCNGNLRPDAKYWAALVN